jgi:hypothetical protein
MIDRAEASDPRLLSFLRSHPRVKEVVEGGGPGLRFQQGTWFRSVEIGNPSLEVAGLVELMDNNPLVCADVASIPDPASTLTLVAIGPLVRASLLVESPTDITNFPAEPDLIGRFLQKEGWADGVTYHSEPIDLGPVLVASCIAAIKTPARLEDIDDLYGEFFGRSFFVQRCVEGWDIDLVLGKNHAVFKMQISPDEPNSLLSIQAMADRDGKCGAAQVVHCMNVMAGFEETLGIG